jgi:thiopeptide-type bacteriocin biosynthesis protein
MSGAAHWRSFHLYYQGDLDLLLVKLVHPLLSVLAEERRIDRFFFVRYALGGPHVRLRLHVTEGEIDAVRDRVTAMAEAFFAQNPAPRTLSDEEIRRTDAAILANDPHERDTGVVAAPSVHERPFEPEVSRYGGAELLPFSLDAFVLSSARARSFLLSHEGAPRARRLPAILQKLVAEASGFASDADELLALLASPFEAYRDAMKAIIERGDRAFQEQQQVFCRIVRKELEALRAPAAALDPLDAAGAARVLAAAIGGAPPDVRRRIAASQLHMSANRLGLNNAEEVYLGRIAWLAASTLFAADAALRARFDEGAREADPDAAVRLREAASRALG